MNIKKKFEILTYNIGFIEKSLDNLMTDGILKGDIIWMKHPYKDRYFADPFLLDSDCEFLYVVCEELFFWEEKGKITLLKIWKKDYSLVSRKVLIEEKTHLSFPFCEYGGDIIVPESSASDKYISYKIDKKAMKVISKETVLDEGTIDAVFCTNANGVWLLTGKKNIPSTELYLYKLGNDGKYIACSDTPVLSNNREARGAGRVFKWKGKMYRPVQDCKGRYGRQTKIMQILQLDEDGYYAKEHITLNSFDNPPYNETMHTFNVYDECIIVDGSKDVLRFPMKLFYKKCSFLFHE